MKDKYNTPVA